MTVQRSDGIGALKTPILRKIARTAPCVHDGRFRMLEGTDRAEITERRKLAAGHGPENIPEVTLRRAAAPEGHHEASPPGPFLFFS